MNTMNTMNAPECGTLIERTLRPIDLIPAFLRECERRGLHWQGCMDGDPFNEGDGLGAALLSEGPWGRAFDPIPDAPYWNDAIAPDGTTADEDAMWVIGQLVDLLNEDLPEGMYFGANEGDGADFGYWPMNDDQDA